MGRSIRGTLQESTQPGEQPREPEERIRHKPLPLNSIFISKIIKYIFFAHPLLEIWVRSKFTVSTRDLRKFNLLLRCCFFVFDWNSTSLFRYEEERCLCLYELERLGQCSICYTIKAATLDWRVASDKIRLFRFRRLKTLSKQKNNYCIMFFAISWFQLSVW